MMKIVFVVAVLIACWAAQVQGDADVDAAFEHHKVNINQFLSEINKSCTFYIGAVN